MNRTQSPEFKTNYNISFQRATHKTLGNGLPVHFINAGTQELVKLDFTFFAGTSYQSKPLVASFTNRLLKEGTSKYSAKHIAETLDYYGSFLEHECGNDTASITLYALTKHLDKLLPLLHDVLFDAEFPEAEFEIYRTNALQKYFTRQQKVSDVASAAFGEILYGSNNFYGYKVIENDYKNIAVDDIKLFYKTTYSLENVSIILSGKIDEYVLDLIQKTFGNGTLKKTTKQPIVIDIKSKTQQKNFIDMPSAMQSAIRIGRILFNKQHPDYLPMLIVNTILGGYFGSRLMTNIREDKGYTYGIGSGISSKLNGGHFYISTEVGVEFTESSLAEIYKEIEILRTVPISKDELELVQNYLVGKFLGSIDGAFALAQKFSGIFFYNLDYDFYSKYLSTIQTITPLQILDLANKYLQANDMLELVVGKMK